MSSGNQVVPYGRTDRYAKSNSRFSQFCQRARKITYKSDSWSIGLKITCNIFHHRILWFYMIFNDTVSISGYTDWIDGMITQ